MTSTHIVILKTLTIALMVSGAIAFSASSLSKQNVTEKNTTHFKSADKISTPKSNYERQLEMHINMLTPGNKAFNAKFLENVLKPKKS